MSGDPNVPAALMAASLETLWDRVLFALLSASKAGADSVVIELRDLETLVLLAEGKNG